MSVRSSSSMEQGELEASPVDFRHEYLASVSLIDVHLENSSHKSESQKSPEPNLEDEDPLQIQPPQPVQSNAKRSKKDKHSRHRSDSFKRNNSSSNKEKSSKHPRIYEESSSSIKEDSHNYQSVSSKDLDRELQRRLERQKKEEQEQIRRRKSLQERERLEKLERERRRKEVELQREMARIHDLKKLERQSRHLKKSDSNDKKESNHKSRNYQKKHKHSPSQSTRDRNFDKIKEEKEKRYLDKKDFSRSSSGKDLFKIDEDKLENFSKQERNKLNENSSSYQSLKNLNNDYDDRNDEEEYSENDDDDDANENDDNNNENEVIQLEMANENLGNDLEEKNFLSDGSSSEFFDPMKIKSKFDDPSDSEDENNNSPSIHSESKSSSAPLSRSPSELDPSPVPSPIENSLPNYYPALQGCRNVEEFHCLNRIEEGTYGVVYRAVDIKTEEIVALKRLKMEKEKEGFPITSLREINTLLKAQHVNIVTVREIVVGSNMDKIYIVMDYVEHDLKSLMEYMKEPFIIGEVKTLMQQLLRGVNHLHDNWIIHRDLKASNLLLSHKGILKIGDFGLAREYGNPLKSYTPIVVTLWYRSPELLLGTKEYSTPIDMWSVGCIYAELLTKKPLFPGKTEIDELNRIFKELGTPNEKIWPGVGELPAMKKCTFTEYPYNQLRQRFGSTLSDRGFDLMNKLLTYDPSKRVTAEDALRHDFFEESPLPVPPNMFPTWPARSEQVRATRSNHVSSPKPPSGGKDYAKLLGDDDEDHVAGFHLNTISKQPVNVTKGPGFALKF